MGQGQGSLTAVVAGLVAAITLAAGPALAAPLSVGDIVRLLEAGVGPEVIVSQGNLTGFPAPPSVDDILRLRQAGASDGLIRALQDAAREPQAPPAPSGVRVYRSQTGDGREVLVLTNLEGGRDSMAAPPASPLRGVISASERSPAAGWAPPAPSSPDRPPAPAQGAASLLPPSIKDGHLAELERRLAELESGAEEARPPVGAGLPRHPINDHRDYPVVTFPFLPVLTPIAVEPQEFKVRSFGPFLSFTGARAAGVDPFQAPGPCRSGQACSIEQRLAHP